MPNRAVFFQDSIDGVYRLMKKLSAVFGDVRLTTEKAAFHDANLVKRKTTSCLGTLPTARKVRNFCRTKYLELCV